MICCLMKLFPKKHILTYCDILTALIWGFFCFLGGRGVSLFYLTCTVKIQLFLYLVATFLWCASAIELYASDCVSMLQFLPNNLSFFDHLLLYWLLATLM